VASTNRHELPDLTISTDPMTGEIPFASGLFDSFNRDQGRPLIEQDFVRKGKIVIDQDAGSV
jgi:hypothetical protein